MNICHINLATGFSGGEQQTLLLIEHQSQRGDQLHVIARQGSPFANRIRTLDCRLTEVKGFLFGHQRALTSDSDVLHVHEGRAVYWALLQNLLFGSPYLITRRIDNPLKRKWLLMLAYRRACHVVGLSQAIKKAIQRTRPDVAVQIIPDSPRSYPVDSEKLAALKSKFAGKFIVLQAAKFHAHKGHEVSINAAKRLEKENPDIVFCLIGDGPELMTIRTLSKDLNNVYLPGQQSNIGDWFALADLLIHPSHSEGLGSVILEANKAGLPVIGTRAGGIPEIIEEGTNGYLIEPGDDKALAEQILKIKNDPALSEKLSHAAIDYVDRFDIRHTARLYDELYKTCLPQSHK